MSRIDEALKRAAAVAPAARSRESRAPDLQARALTLDDYPIEGPSGGSGLPAEQPDGGSEPGPTGTTPRIALHPCKLVVGAQSNPMAIEQYRRLAGTLHDLQTERNMKSVLVTSALPRDGKTLSVVNLALTLSESYRRRVLLIDADLRRPAVSEVLGLPNRKGLGDALKSSNGALPLLEASPLLTVLPAGRPNSNPVGGIASDRMRAILAQCGRTFDWVLLDAPPIMLLPDAALLSKLVDGVLLVIGAGSTPWPMVERTIAELGKDCIIGTILNRVEDGSIPATSYYQHYYRQHHGE